METPAVPDQPIPPRDGGDPESPLPERIKVIGGLIAVGIGVIAVATVAIVACALDSEDAATIASAAGGVIATIVGAYFGVKAGTDRAKAAGDDTKAEAAKAQVYALYLPPDEADEVLKEANAAARRALRS
jgi:hypothetical protein